MDDQREQTYDQAVREGRIFYRRRLAERITRDAIRQGGSGPFWKTLRLGELAQSAVELADAVARELWVLEEKDLKKRARAARRQGAS